MNYLKKCFEVFRLVMFVNRKEREEYRKEYSDGKNEAILFGLIVCLLLSVLVFYTPKKRLATPATQDQQIKELFQKTYGKEFKRIENVAMTLDDKCYINGQYVFTVDFHKAEEIKNKLLELNEILEFKTIETHGDLIEVESESAYGITWDASECGVIVSGNYEEGMLTVAEDYKPEIDLGDQRLKWNEEQNKYELVEETE